MGLRGRGQPGAPENVSFLGCLHGLAEWEGPVGYKFSRQRGRRRQWEGRRSAATEFPATP